LWPDPADELCPEAFRESAFHLIADFAREAITNRTVRDKLLSESTLGRVLTINQENGNFGPGNPSANLVLQQTLLDFIADFANWDASTNPLFLKTARALTQAAHEALGGVPGTRPMVVDPFAGGGSIPLEALRVGADTFSSDLNPVAVLLNKVVLEYIPKYGQRLADEVRKSGEWIKKEAEKELSEFYPKDPDGMTPIAYLWARTVQCEGPGCGAEVPLMRSLWLAKKANRSVALQLVPKPKEKRVDFEIIVKQSDGWVNQANPKTKIENPRFDGTVKRGSATCPCCGYTTPVARIREQLKSRQGGASDARLYCVVTSNPVKSGRYYRAITNHDSSAAQNAALELDRRKHHHKGPLSLCPEEQLPLMSGVFNAPIYGHTTWGSLFIPRQLLTLSVLSRLAKQAGETVHTDDAEFRKALQVILALAVDRVAVRCTAQCIWDGTTECIMQIFNQGQAIPVRFEFAEMIPLIDEGSGWPNSFRYYDKVFTHLVSSITIKGQVAQCSATNHVLPNDSADAFITDPPYYNAVPYADLSDFFYVWLRRTLSDSFMDIFTEPLSPKEEELCEMAGWDSVRYPHKDKQFFETGMTKAMAEGRRVLKPNGIAIVVFANKSTSGWEALLQAMIDAGWIITGSWPIDTESENRLRAQGSAALASSVHLVCRPRENSDGSQRSADVGEWRDILNELPRRIHEWMPRLAQEGVVGADAIFACLGPALEIFSRYSVVEKTSGDKVELREYLEHVWAAVAREALNMIFQGADASGFEEDARLTAMWLWTLRTPDANGHAVEAEESDEAEGDTGNAKSTVSGYSLEYDAARKIAQGLGAHLEALGHLVEVKGETATLLPAGARTRYLFGKEATQAPRPRRRNAERQLTFEFAHELEDVEEEAGIMHGNLSARPGATVLDQLHQSMILFGAGRGEALKRFLVDEGVGRNPLFWRLAQSLSALYPSSSDEKRWVDGVMARKKGLGL
jgi:adenine-specific DNA methylase